MLRTFYTVARRLWVATIEEWMRADAIAAQLKRLHDSEREHMKKWGGVR